MKAYIIVGRGPGEHRSLVKIGTDYINDANTVAELRPLHVSWARYAATESRWLHDRKADRGEIVAQVVVVVEVVLEWCEAHAHLMVLKPF
jgi:hypothetical protein